MVLDEARIGRAARGAQFRRRPADALDRGYQHLAERTGRRQEGFATDGGGEFVTAAGGVEALPQRRIERGTGPGVVEAYVETRRRLRRDQVGRRIPHVDRKSVV